MKARILVLVLVTVALSACTQDKKATAFPHPPETFTELDLVGTWRATYGAGAATDTILIQEDGTYKQIYHSSPDGHHYESPWYEWFTEESPNGWLYVHLKGMRYCPLTHDVCWLEDGGGGGRSFYDSGEDQMIKMDGEVILRVVGVDGVAIPGIESTTRGVILLQMRPDLDRPIDYFSFE